MNLTAAIMLVNTAVRPVRVEYDPDVKWNNNPNRVFKTLDPALKKDDYVVVPTHTRHGFTVCKVSEVDFNVDFSDTGLRWDWIVGQVDKTTYDTLIEQEKVVVSRIGKAEENRMRKQLADSMGLGSVDFTDLDIVKGTAVPAIATMRGSSDAPIPDAAPSATEAPAS